MSRVNKKMIWVSCPDCIGEGFKITENGVREQCWRCHGRQYIPFANTKKIVQEFTVSPTALKSFPQHYWWRVADSLLGHIDKLETNRWYITNKLNKLGSKDGN